MPTFCRHNRLLQNCTICAREQNFDARPLVSSSAPKSSQPHEHESGDGAARTPRTSKAPASARAAGSSRTGVRVRRLARGVEDGFRSPLVPGLKSSQDAERLADELAFATWRLSLMEQVAAGDSVPEVPVIWAELAAPDDLDVRTLNAARHVLNGPRGLQDGTRVEEAVSGLEAWGARSGSISAAFNGESSWNPERRFERIFERLGGVGGLERDARFELLTLLGHLGLYDLRAGKLFLSGENEATWAAKRALGIGDPLLLERRADDLAGACGAPLDALDLGFHNWGSGTRVTDGLPDDAEGDELVLDQARSALGL